MRLSNLLEWVIHTIREEQKYCSSKIVVSNGYGRYDIVNSWKYIFTTILWLRSDSTKIKF